MTQNQISYFKAKEEERHNKIMESETQRSNLAQEKLKAREQNITQSHYERADAINLLGNEIRGQELSLGYAKLDETKRSNLANEGIARTRANADAYLSYSTAGLRQAEEALTDLKASNVAADTSLLHAKEQHEYAEYYNTLANVGYTNARTENVLMQTNMMPIQTVSQAIGSIAKGAGSLTGAGKYYY